jgi:hypothetical protein
MNHDYIKESNLIDQYVLGKLATHEAEAFEDHFIECPQCVEQLNITRSFIHDLKGIAVQETLSSDFRRLPQARRRPLQQLVPVRLLAAIAFACVIVGVVFAFYAARRLGRLEAELRQAKEESASINQKYQQGLATAAESEKQYQVDRQQLVQRVDELEKKLNTEGSGNQSSGVGSKAPDVNFPIFVLTSVARGSAPAPVELVLPASSSRFALSLPVEDRREFSSYRVTIMDHRGAPVLKQGGFKPDAYHALSLSLNSNFLASGNYDLRVEGLTPTNEWTTIGSYPFRIKTRR